MSLSTHQPPVADLYTQLLPKGLRVQLNPNAVELSVAQGEHGCILSLSAMGVRIRMALNADAKAHLINLLNDQKDAG